MASCGGRGDGGSWGGGVLFVNDPATTEIYTTEDTLSLHDALPISRAWFMTITLADLGDRFSVQRMNGGGQAVPKGLPDGRGRSQAGRSEGGRFAVTPGVYVLSASGPVDPGTLPARVGQIGFTEYHAPPVDSLPPSVQPLAATEYLVGRPAELRARIVDQTPPDSVTLFIRPTAGGFWRGLAMRPGGGEYEYAASVPGEVLAQ